MRWAVFAVFLSALGCPAETVDVVILHTGAVRGHVFSLRYREHTAHYGGLLRCSTLIRDLRNEHPAALLIDGGGLIFGSSESDLSAGRLPLRAAGYMGYDARVLLPDELNGGLDAFRVRQESSRVPLIAANLEVSPRAGPAKVQHERYRAWIVDGVRVALTAIILGNHPIAFRDGEGVLRMLPPEESVNKVLREMRTLDADIMLLAIYSTLTSGSVRRISRFIAAQPEFDAVLVCAGERIEWNRSDWRKVSNLFQDGLEVGMVKFLYDRETKRIVKTEVEYRRAGNEVPEDQALRQSIGPELGRIEHELFSVVGYSNRQLGGTSSFQGQSGIQTLISAAIRERFPCDITLVEKGSGGYLGKGAILSRDVFRAIPDLRILGAASLTPAELRSVLEENAGRLGSPSMLGIDGAHYSLVLQSGENPSVQDLTVDGRKPHGRARIRVLFPASLLEPERGFESLRALREKPEVRSEILDVDTRKLVAEYVKKHSPLDVKATSGVDIVERESAGDP
jgi:hypothetical protein